MYNSGKSEQIIQNVVGCGPFQVLHVFIVFFVTKVSGAFTLIFMSFGNYNPGWRCLDYNNTSPGGYTKDNCSLFESCEHIEFAPGTSTIVSEWGLLCDKAWIPSFMISLQMAGLFVGCIFAGQLGDAIGRKLTIAGAQILLVVLNIACIFSTYWQMFAALLFLIGVSLAFNVTLAYVYIVEFTTRRWRAPLPNMPYWSILCVLFGLTCLGLKDWRHICIVSSVTALVAFFALLWLPESLRWLEVKNKKDQFEKAVMKIAKMNGKTVPRLDNINIGTDQTNEKTDKVYKFWDLFRKEYRMYTLFITFPWFSMSLIYYAISFGVKALSGNFYLNLILMYTTEIPFTFLPMIAPNVLGRKKAAVTFVSVSGLCLLVTACFERLATGSLKTTGTVILVNIGRITMGGFWGIMQLYTSEIYPTVVRGLGNAWGSGMARIGAIIAPFLIPKEPSKFFVCYAIMGCLGLLCCVVITRLPETRGIALKETFHEADSVRRNEREVDDCDGNV